MGTGLLKNETGSKAEPWAEVDTTARATMGTVTTTRLQLVVLAWESVLSGAADIHDGHNVVLHEFSSVFDYMTFGLLLLVLHATQVQFRTTWFVESVVSASLIVLVIRSRKPFFSSRPGNSLLLATLSVVVIAVVVPFTPLAAFLGFGPMPLVFLLCIGLIVSLYVVAAELVKRMFYKRVRL
jgi:magnesium-transporting ATPase (P-type)